MELKFVEKIYVCHCKSLIDRVEFIKTQLDKYNLDACWVTSYDREDLNDETLNELMPLHDQNFTFLSSRRKLRIPEISIMLKHFVIWADMVINNIGTALILEDDVVLSINFVEKFNKQIEKLDLDFDFVWVGSCCDMNLPHTDSHLIPNKMSRCAHGYLLNNKTAKILIENFKNNNFPVDIYFNNIIQSLDLRSYWMEPDLIRQSNTFETSIQNKY